MSFERNIHKKEARAHKATPPQPRSSDHDVLKILAPNKFWASLADPCVINRPSIVPS